jgi:hypothetical protein
MKHLFSNAVRLIVKGSLIVCGVFCVLVSALLLSIGSKQAAKNKTVLADMKDRVSAVQAFASKEGRLPDRKEFTNLIASLPVRFTTFDYQLSDARETTPVKIEGLQTWPKGGWVLYFWRGEWFEWYSSWNDHYSLADQVTIWSFGGSFMIATGLVGLACFSALGHKRLRKDP